MKTPSEAPADAKGGPRKPERRVWQLYFFRAIVVMIAGAVLSWTFWSFKSGGVMLQVDAWVLDWMGARQSATLEAAMRMASALATFPAIAVQALVVGVFLARQMRWSLLAGLLIAVVAGSSLNGWAKVAIKRERPRVEVAVPARTDYSFPSGHTAAAALFYGFVSVAALRDRRRGRSRFAVVVACVGAILLVGFSRIYLRLHFVSDVVGGMAIGCAWLPFAITIGELVGGAVDSKRDAQ